MADDFVASVPFRRVRSFPADADSFPVAEGVTVGARPFALRCCREQPYPALQLVVGPSPAVPGGETMLLRADLPALVGRLTETGALGSTLDENVAAALDVLRGALSGMVFPDPKGHVVTGMDLFGQALDAMTACAAAWRRFTEEHQETAPGM